MFGNVAGPPARWAVARKSPAFRIYRSLPVREKIYPRNDEIDTEDDSFPLPQAVETLARNDDCNSLVSHSDQVENRTEGARCKGNDVAIDDYREQAVSCNSQASASNESSEDTTRHNETKLENATSADSLRTRKNERETVSTATNVERYKIEQTDNFIGGTQESNTPTRVSLIKPPRIIAKFLTNEVKQSPKHGDRKSNIPIFRRSSREFEDIGSPQESVKRSMIPQRYASIYFLVCEHRGSDTLKVYSKRVTKF